MASENMDMLEIIFEKFGKFEEMEKRIHDLERTIENQSTKMKQLEDIVQPQLSQLDAQLDEDHMRHSFNRQRRFVLDRGIQEQPVAFTAYLDKALNNLGEGQTLHFNKLLLNDGRAYNNTTGIFTCPITGVYLFAFFISEFGVHDTRVRLVVDGINQVDGITEGMHQAANDQGGNLAILSLRQGQSVWLEVFNFGEATSGANLEATDNHRRNTFSGVLLYAL